jgi:amidase
MVTDSLLKTYADSDALDLVGLVRGGQVSPAELVEAAITLVERLNPALNAVIHRLYDMARAQAQTVDRSAPFAGVPFLLKELASSWTGAPNTNSCFYLRDVVADSDTEVVRRMKAAGLVLVGKSNAPENGWSITTEPNSTASRRTRGRRASRPAARAAGRRRPSLRAWCRSPKPSTAPVPSAFQPHAEASSA